MAIVSETRQPGHFTEIVVQGYGELTVEQREIEAGAETVTVEADESVLPKLKTEVRDGRLLLGIDLQWWEWFTWWLTWLGTPDKTLRFHVVAPEISGMAIEGSGFIKAARVQAQECTVRISGSGRAEIGELAAQALRISIAGSGHVRADALDVSALSTAISGSGDADFAGKAGCHEIRISGSGDVRAGSLVTEETAVTISGAGRVQAHANETLDVNISGSGEVRYEGQPKVTQHISGSGRVAPAR